MKKNNTYRMYYALIALCLAMLLNSCKKCDQKTTVDFEKESLIQIDSLTQRGDIDALFNIQAKARNEIMETQPTTSSFPEAYAQLAVDAFSLAYKANAINPNVKFEDLTIYWDQVVSATDLINIQTSTDKYVAFYYVVNNSPSIIPYSTFVIAQGLVKTKTGGGDTIEPVSLRPDGRFLMVSNTSSSGEWIEKDSFVKYFNNYKNSIKFYDVYPWPRTGPYNVKDYYIPLCCAHEPKRLYDFFTQNQSETTYNTNMKFRIRNGVVPPKSIEIREIGDINNILDAYYHVPILSVVDGAGNIMVDDNKHVTGKEWAYRNADLGRMCPPQCK
jgi:hypothetical protein